MLYISNVTNFTPLSQNYMIQTNLLSLLGLESRSCSPQHSHFIKFANPAFFEYM